MSISKNNLILYIGILVFGIAAPYLFPAFKVQLSILCVLIVLATTWNIQGGEMGYNSFGNILLESQALKNLGLVPKCVIPKSSIIFHNLSILG